MVLNSFLQAVQYVLGFDIALLRPRFFCTILMVPMISSFGRLFFDDAIFFLKLALRPAKVDWGASAIGFGAAVLFLEDLVFHGDIGFGSSIGCAIGDTGIGAAVLFWVDLVFLGAIGDIGFGAGGGSSMTSIGCAIGDIGIGAAVLFWVDLVFLGAGGGSSMTSIGRAIGDIGFGAAGGSSMTSMGSSMSLMCDLVLILIINGVASSRCFFCC